MRLELENINASFRVCRHIRIVLVFDEPDDPANAHRCH